MLMIDCPWLWFNNLSTWLCDHPSIFLFFVIVFSNFPHDLMTERVPITQTSHKSSQNLRQPFYKLISCLLWLWCLYKLWTLCAGLPGGHRLRHQQSTSIHSCLNDTPWAILSSGSAGGKRLNPRTSSVWFYSWSYSYCWGNRLLASNFTWWRLSLFKVALKHLGKVFCVFLSCLLTHVLELITFPCSPPSGEPAAVS